MVSGDGKRVKTFSPLGSFPEELDRRIEEDLDGFRQILLGFG